MNPRQKGALITLQERSYFVCRWLRLNEENDPVKCAQGGIARFKPGHSRAGTATAISGSESKNLARHRRPKGVALFIRAERFVKRLAALLFKAGFD